ncbi:MAG TPA: helix-hairpin-helix domain-containing protein [Polyangiales bacterium]|nr:helix-hairpin-helix domain-containing protein [Polyangiales bacterium]
MSVHDPIERPPVDAATELDTPAESEFYELKDDEFTLEAEEVEANGHAVPPLPRWAAASRALLDGSRPPRDDEQHTIEVVQTPTLERASSELSAREKLARLVKKVNAREIYVQEVERALHAAVGRVRGQAFRIAELEDQLRFAHEKAPSQPPETRATPRKRILVSDDLQQIAGIGPSTQQKLKRAGVVTFEAIAKWSAADTIEIAARIGVSRERIAREGWIKQAKALRKRRR